MRTKMFKIAGVKNEKDFYKKFPTEAAFMKKHGKAFKKAQMGLDFSSFEGMDGVMKGANIVGDVVQGIQGIKQEKEQLKGAKQSLAVSDVNLAAARTRPEEIERSYARPEDIQNTGEEFFPIYGVGTNVIAQNGYTKLRKGQMGLAEMAPGISQAANSIGNALYGENAGADLGGTLGKTAGSLFGPVGGLVGEQVGKFAGWALDRNPARIKKAENATTRNINGMSGMGVGAQVQQQYNNFQQDGGATSGGLDNEIKTHWGGRSEPISYNPFLPGGGETIEFKGNMHNGNNTPGKSGIGISYNGNPIEVEGGEPAVKLQNGGAEESMVVFGNLKIPKDMLGDPNADGKKFKNYIKDISDKEEKSNKAVEKNVKGLNEITPLTPFDKLRQNSHKANIKGNNMKLKDYAGKKEKASQLQKTINDTASAYGIVAADLAVGKITKDKGKFTPSNKTAKNGAIIPIAQDGKNDKKQPTPEELKAKGYDYDGEDENGNTIYTRIIEGRPAERILVKEGQDAVAGSTKTTSGSPMRSMQQAYANRGVEFEHDSYEEYVPKAQKWIKDNPKKYATAIEQSRPKVTHIGGSPAIAPIYEDLAGIDDISDSITLFNEESKDPKKRNGEGWNNALTALNSILPNFRPSDAEGLDPNQLMGEMYALSHNKLEPVPAQGYYPQLDVPYDISLQEQRNEITSGTRAGQRLAGYNPGAQMMMAADSYNAKNKVNAEEFRLNQAKKDQVYSGNRATMNDAQLKNLGIFDKQAERQAMARANTKEVDQLALNSISDKRAKNQLEQRTLGTYENLYNYRYMDNMRAQNMNPAAQFDTQAKFGQATGSVADQMMQAQAYMDNLKKQYKASRTDASESTSTDKPQLATPNIFAQDGAYVRDNTNINTRVRKKMPFKINPDGKAVQANQRAHQQSSEQAEYETINEGIIQNMQDVNQHPLWHTPGAITAGAVAGPALMEHLGGVVNTLKGPGSAYMEEGMLQHQPMYTDVASLGMVNGIGQYLVQKALTNMNNKKKKKK